MLIVFILLVPQSKRLMCSAIWWWEEKRTPAVLLLVGSSDCTVITYGRSLSLRRVRRQRDLQQYLSIDVQDGFFDTE